ncbi:MAG: ABC transporter substrate-binding protein [Candidatus Fimivivens sp.]
MKKIRLYWSNICVMHRAEVTAINKAKEVLSEKGIDLDVTYFGLGTPQHMSEYLYKSDSILPDLLISTDLEVFEDQRIFDKLLPKLNPLANAFSLNPKIKNSNIYQNEYLLPLLAIPLVLCSNQPFNEQNHNLANIIQHQLPITFGGINNSGAKSIIKAIWYTFGKEKVHTLLENADIVDMPIQAFHKVRTGAHNLSIVPYIYAQTADEKNLFVKYPQEGAIALPCYAAALNTIDNAEAKAVIDAIFTAELQQTYVEKSGLACCLDSGAKLKLAEEAQYRFTYPTREWFDETAWQEFYALYLKYLPNAFSGTP